MRIMLLLLLITGCADPEMAFRINVPEPEPVEIVDELQVVEPCGPGGEVIFIIDETDFFAYFEHRNNRYLVLLEEGAYRTTDGTNCRFKIENGCFIDATQEICL